MAAKLRDTRVQSYRSIVEKATKFTFPTAWHQVWASLVADEPVDVGEKFAYWDRAFKALGLLRNRTRTLAGNASGYFSPEPYFAMHDFARETLNDIRTIRARGNPTEYAILLDELETRMELLLLEMGEDPN